MFLKLSLFGVLFSVLIYKSTAFPHHNGTEHNIEKRAAREVDNLKNRQCNIRNVYQDEFLYAASNSFDYDDDRRTIFTWRHKNERVIQGTWEFKPTGEDSVFKIKNTNYDEHLYAANDYFKFDSDRRRVFTWKRVNIDGNEFNWYIRHEGGNHFSLKNQATNDYLYAAGDGFAYDNDRRRVYNWAPGTREQEAVWELHC